MNIGDIIAAITGGMDPNKAILDAQGAMPGPPGPPPQQAGPPPPTAPQGAQTAFTNPQPNERAPNITQSPPDLANMYVKLMKDNQNAQALDSGATLIAAGLSNNLATRQSLIQSASAGGGKGAGITSTDIINLQKQQQAQQDAMTRKAALGGLMKQYKMTPDQIQYLEASGTLPDVLKHYSTENLGQVKDEDGRTHLINQRSGKVITTIGSEKEDPTQVVAGPTGPQVINMRTGAPVASGVGLPPDKIEVTLADGSKQIIDKNAIPSGGQVAPPRKVGDEIPNMENERAIANAERKAKGLDPISVEDFKKLTVTPATNINVGMDGSVLGKAPEGYEWERDPGTGKVLLDEKGHAKYYKPEGGKPADAAAVTAKEDAEKVKKEAQQQRLKMASASAVVRSANEAEKIIDEAPFYAPAAGFGASVGGYFGGTPTTNLKSKLGEINANTAFTQLKAMRESSTTGASGLGQVTDFEQKMLASATANLDQYQDPQQLKAALRKAKATMLVLAENSFDYKDAAGFDAALNSKIAEMEKSSGAAKGRHGNIRLKE